MEIFKDIQTTYTSRKVTEVRCDKCGCMVDWDADHGERYPHNGLYQNCQYLTTRITYGGKREAYCYECAERLFKSGRFFKEIMESDKSREFQMERGHLPSEYNQDDDRHIPRKRRKTDE